MSYFLSDKNLAENQTITIEGNEAAHIMLSRRIKPGERIFLQGPDGKRFETEVVKLNKKFLDIKTIKPVTTPAEPKTKITLLQSIIAEKALDFVFQKGTELMANKIVLFNSARTATRLTQDQFNKKKPRWEKILWEAAKQSGRATIPLLEFSEHFPSEGRTKGDYDKLFILDISGSKLPPFALQPSSVGLIIGPEGGFTQAEVEEFKKIPNAECINLGPTILKAETAAIASLAICRNMLE